MQIRTLPAANGRVWQEMRQHFPQEPEAEQQEEAAEEEEAEGEERSPVAVFQQWVSSEV